MPQIAIPDRQILYPSRYEVDWSHPLARGLYVSILVNSAGVPFDLARKYPISPTRIGLPGTSCGPMGNSVNTRVADTNSWSLNATDSSTSWTGFTCVMWMRPVYVVQYRYCRIGNSNWYIHVQQEASNQQRQIVRVTTDVAGSSTAAINTISAFNTWRQAAGTWDTNDQNIRSYENGKQLNSVARTGSTCLPFQYIVYFGGYNSGQYFDGELSNLFLWDRGLSASEITELYGEPYAFIKEIKRRTYGVISGEPQPTPISVTDATEGSDTIASILASIPVADTAIASDAAAITALLTLADTAGVTDDLVREIFVNVLDSTGAVDSSPTINAALALLEAISASDTSGITAILQIADLVGATDEALVGVAMAILDSVSVTDSTPTIEALIPILENIVSADTPLLGCVLQLLDSVDLTDLAWRSGDWFLVSDFVDIAESIAPISASVPISELIQVTDAIQWITVSFSLSDTVEAIDSIVAGALYVQITELLSAIDGVSNISVSAPVTDVTGLTDSISLIFQMTVTDAVTAVDSIITQLFPIVTDAIGFTDSISGVTVALTIPDTTVASDAIAALTAVLTIAETVGLTDQLTINAAITITDTGAFSDDLTRINFVELLEALQSVDSVGEILVTVPLQDDISAADAIASILAILSIADAAGMTDTMVKWDLTAGNQITSIGFVMRKRSTTFGWE